MSRKEAEAAITDSCGGRVTRFGSVAELMADLNADDVQADAHEHSRRLAAGRRGRAAAPCIMLAGSTGNAPGKRPVLCCDRPLLHRVNFPSASGLYAGPHGSAVS
jgi:hypothetical protein